MRGHLMKTWRCCYHELSSEISHCQQCGQSQAQQEASLIQLFHESAKDLSQQSIEELEITPTGTLKPEREESIRLLFTLAQRALEDSSIEQRFQETGTRSTERHVKSKAAQKQLEVVEETLHRKVFSLKGGSTLSQGHKKALKPEPATLTQRLVVAILDGTGMFLTGVGIAAAIGLSENSPLLLELFHTGAPLRGIAKAYGIGNLISGLLVGFLLYPFIPVMFGKTRSLGMLLMNCELYDPNLERRLPYSAHLLRHILLPITVILELLLALPQLIKRGALDLTDRLCGSRMATQTPVK